MELDVIHGHNQKLIERHGHEDHALLQEKGMYNYADYMDVNFVRRHK